MSTEIAIIRCCLAACWMVLCSPVNDADSTAHRILLHLVLYFVPALLVLRYGNKQPGLVPRAACEQLPLDLAGAVLDSANNPVETPVAVFAVDDAWSLAEGQLGSPISCSSSPVASSSLPIEVSFTDWKPGAKCNFARECSNSPTGVHALLSSTTSSDCSCLSTGTSAYHLRRRSSSAGSCSTITSSSNASSAGTDIPPHQVQQQEEQLASEGSPSTPILFISTSSRCISRYCSRGGANAAAGDSPLPLPSPADSPLARRVTDERDQHGFPTCPALIQLLREQQEGHSSGLEQQDEQQLVPWADLQLRSISQQLEELAAASLQVAVSSCCSSSGGNAPAWAQLARRHSFTSSDLQAATAPAAPDTCQVSSTAQQDSSSSWRRSISTGGSPLQSQYHKHRLSVPDSASLASDSGSSNGGYATTSNMSTGGGVKLSVAELVELHARLQQQQQRELARAATASVALGRRSARA